MPSSGNDTKTISIMPLYEILRLDVLYRFDSPHGKKLLNSQVIERVARGRKILLERNSRHYQAAKGFFEEAANIIVMMMQIRYTDDEKRQFIAEYKMDPQRKLSECSDSLALMEVAAKTYANAARTCLRMTGMNTQATLYFRRAAMLLRKGLTLNTQQQNLANQYYEASLSSGWSGVENIGKDRVLEVYQSLKRNPEHSEVSLINYVINFVNGQVLNPQEIDAFALEVLSRTPSSLKEVTENMLRCTMLVMSRETEFQQYYDQLEKQLVQYNGETDGVGAVNVFLIYHVQLLGVAMNSSHIDISELQNIIDSLYTQASTASFTSSQLLEIADHTLLMLDPPQLIESKKQSVAEPPMADSSTFLYTGPKVTSSELEKIARMAGDLQNNAESRKQMKELSDQSYRNLRREAAENHKIKYDRTINLLQKDEIEPYDIEHFFIATVSTVRNLLMKNDREWFEICEENLARGLDLFAKANLINSTKDFIDKYIEKTAHTSFISDPSSSSANYELYARSIANLADLDTRINQNINCHKAASLYRRAAMTLYMAHSTNESLNALAERWTQKANKLSTCVKRNVMNQVFRDLRHQVREVSQEERGFLAEVDLLHSNASHREPSQDETLTRMQNLYKLSLIEHCGHYDNLLDSLSLVVMPPKAAPSVSTQGLSAKKKKEMDDEKQFARAAFSMK